MTKFSKVLVVFVVSASLAFMGFAAVNAVGGTNWNVEKDKFKDFTFKYTPGENPTWTATPRKGDAGAKTSKVLPDVIIWARQQMIAAQTEEIEALEAEIPIVQAKLKEAQEFVKIDLKAMQKREQELEQELADLNQQINDISNEGIKKATEANKTREEARRRREDVFRLRGQLDEIRTDRFQILEQKKKLYDQLFQMNGFVERLERRKLQLEKSGAKDDYEEDAKK